MLNSDRIYIRRLLYLVDNHSAFEDPHKMFSFLALHKSYLQKSSQIVHVFLTIQRTFTHRTIPTVFLISKNQFGIKK